MKTIMARSPYDSSFSSSFSKRHFPWKKSTPTSSTVSNGVDVDDREDELFNFSSSSSSSSSSAAKVFDEDHAVSDHHRRRRRRHVAVAVSLSRFRSVVAAALSSVHHHHRGNAAGAGGTDLGSRVICTLFGHRRGRVHFAFQADPRAPPTAVVELAAPTSSLIREMASGLVRIALECDRSRQNGNPNSGIKLLDERVWRAYCNGKKCGYATRKECGEEEMRVLKAVEPVTMGAGVLPAAAGVVAGGEGKKKNVGEMMYMRARFERVVGSKDSEAFYMINPDGNGGPELSIYFLRV